MQRTLIRFFLCALLASAPLQAAKEILLQFSPETNAPVIAKITATDKVILDAAPAERNADQGWRQLPLPTPFEGYVPIATVNKGMAILGGTPVHYLPTTESAKVTTVEEGDRYEIVRAKEEWVTVRFYKDITGYFLATEEAPSLNLSFTKNTTPVLAMPPAQSPTPVPVTIPAPQKRINPDEPIAQVDPNSLPPENVQWKPVLEPPTEQHLDPARGLSSQSINPASPISDLVVTPSNTQARESTPVLKPAKTPRLLTGQLVREIAAEGPAYPVRLKSPEGRLIAYVDFSGIFISDLSPYIDQKVYLRGEVHPLSESNSQLVIYVQDIRLAE